MDAFASRGLSQKSEFRRRRESLRDKRAPDHEDAKFAFFENDCPGQVAGKQDKKPKMPAPLNSQPVVHALRSNHAEPDESETQSWLVQLFPVSNAPSQTSPRPHALQLAWAILQSRLKSQPPLDPKRRDAVEVNDEIAPAQQQRKKAHGAGSADTSDGTLQIELAETQPLQVSIHHSGPAITQADLNKTRWQKQIRLNSGAGGSARGLEADEKPDRTHRLPRGLPMLVSYRGSRPEGAMSASIPNLP